MKKTKLLILESFEALLLEKSFEKITVNDIIAKANISRATFYRHFKDKYDLASYKFVQKSGILVESYTGLGSLENLSLAIAKYLYLNKDYYEKIFKTDGQNSLENTIVESCENSYKKTFSKIYNNSVPDEIIGAIEIYSHGIASYYKLWAIKGFKESPEFVAKLQFKCLPEILRKNL